MTDTLIDLGVDFETYYDSDYSIKKMENAEYVMDDRFEIIGVSIKEPGKPAEWITGTIDEVYYRLKQYDWSKIRVVSHNARFDGSILEWRLGLKPAAYLCTMVGSRPHLVPYAGGQGLDDISSYLGLPPKGDYVHKVQGKHRVDFDSAEIADYGIYCCRDTYNAVSIGEELSRILPPDEQFLIDLTLKKYLRPTLNLNKNALLRRLQDLQARKAAHEEKLFKDHGVTLEEVRSRIKFAALLAEAMGYGTMVTALPMKTNKKGKQTFAFAKDDVEFKQLLANPSQKVRDLVAAKIAFSSTIDESRTKELIKLCDVMDGANLGATLPVPLVYYGAHTGRLSGDHGINLQNLPRVEWDKETLVKGHLRFAVEAPAGYDIVAADLSNIEARIVATLAGQWDLVEGFRLGRDIYSEFATKIYGYAVNKKDHPRERFVGKTCILGLGYGMGWKKFHLKMMQEGIVMDEREAMRIVRLYRETYPEIPKLWRYFEQCAAQYVTVPGSMFPSPVAGLIFAHERIILPNGMPILYPGLSRTGDGLKYRSRFGAQNLQPEQDGPADAATYLRNGTFTVLGAGQNIWGGAFTENIAQALARIILTRSEITLARAGLSASLQVHDELVYRVPKAAVQQVIKAIAKVMTREVDFMPDLPVAVEIHHGPTYGDAK